MPEGTPSTLDAAIAELRTALPIGGGRRVIAGVCPGARAVAVAALADADGGTVVVVPSPRDAEELAAGLRLLFPELRCAPLPAEAVETYRGHPPPLGATSALVHALVAAATGDVTLLIAPARLLLYPLPDPRELAARALSLRPNDRIDSGALAARLAAGGYRRVDVVEEAGEFALRGQVIDIGSPERFVRVLIDVDSIERLALFDPTTQRSAEAIELASFPPLRPFAATAEERTALAARLETHGCPAAALAALDGVSEGWWEGLLGWTAPHARVWQLLPRLVVCETASVAAEVERTMAALARARAELASDQVALPEPGEWLAAAPEVEGVVGAADAVVELAVDEAAPPRRIRTAPTPVLASRPQALIEELRRGLAERLAQALVAASPGEAQRLLHLLAEAEVPAVQGWPKGAEVGVVTGELAKGFVWHEARLVVFGRGDITTLPPPARQRRTLASVLSELRDLTPGDVVVHIEHGLGRFLGLRTLSIDGAAHECVELEYAGGGKLLVPLERADVLEKYAGAEDGAPKLDRLGGVSWSRTKSRVKKALKDLAEELLKTHAQREVTPGFAFSRDGPWQREFESSFEYELTRDQASAIAEVKHDMESSRPMDRLLVGDVGYGKTEVAMRAAFKAVMDGKQVALLAPTTILAEQHFRTFSRRFAGFPVEIRWLSRFLPASERRVVVAALAAGTVDVIVGTHRLLGKDVRFRDLGLVIIDEEQRFGVAQKERLKSVRASVDLLSLSATPIPRTLNLGLLGLRDVSIIETPPRDRLAVQTHVLPFRRETVREAVITELARGGQVFFVHNRVASIGAIAELLREIVPEANVVVAHGQMDERLLEKAVDSFIGGTADVLLATAIVENGLDIPNANTLIVNRADHFGLAQLYQLRGRVGRSDRLAFAYLLVPPERSLSDTARERLAAIVEFAALGAGFRIAARDLEIRGAGSLLGAEQHGHLRAVGYQTYCHLLEEAVAELRGEAPPPAPTAVELHLGLDLRLPESFIPEETLRLVVYRNVAAARDDGDLVRLTEELADRFGPPPTQLANLLLHQRLRRHAEARGVVKVKRGAAGYELVLDPAHPAAHGTGVRLLTTVPNAVAAPGGAAVRIPGLPRDPVEAAGALLKLLA
jgi:transcription-repair coupling factor (superfamily II helicase)